MNINDLKTIEQLEQFLTGSQAVAFLVASSKDECYRGIQRTLVKFRYPSLTKRSKGVVVRFLIKLTGYSRQQITRLVKQYRDTGKIERQHRTYQGFERLYTAEDIRLLASLDERHNTLSGPATKKLCERAHKLFKQTQYQRLAGISIAHLYNLRKSQSYLRQRYTFEKNRPQVALIGIRKSHEPMVSPALFGLIRFIRAIKISKKAARIALWTHRINGFAFTILAIFITQYCIRIIGVYGHRDEPAVVLHLATAIPVVLLPLMKIAITSRYPGWGSLLPGMGLTTLLLTWITSWTVILHNLG